MYKIANLDFKDEIKLDWKLDKDTSQEEKGLIWWEKTVESLFFQRVYKNGFSVAQLAGALERLLGDAVANDGEKYHIFEFKTSSKTIKTEEKKFRKSQVAGYEEYIYYIQDSFIEELGSESMVNREPHTLCYGYEMGGDLKLWFQDYWGRDTKPRLANKREFSAYVYALSQVRLPPETGSIAGGVVAVSAGRPVLLDLQHVLVNIKKKYDLEPSAVPTF